MKRRTNRDKPSIEAKQLREETKSKRKRRERMRGRQKESKREKRKEIMNVG